MRIVQREVEGADGRYELVGDMRSDLNASLDLGYLHVALQEASLLFSHGFARHVDIDEALAAFLAVELLELRMCRSRFRRSRGERVESSCTLRE